jgi:hypothetical protein
LSSLGTISCNYSGGYTVCIWRANSLDIKQRMICSNVNSFIHDIGGDAMYISFTKLNQSLSFLVHNVMSIQIGLTGCDAV